MGKMKFKNNRLKFKLTPTHIENGNISGDTKFTVYGDFEDEKVVVIAETFTYDMKMFREFLIKMEALKTNEENEKKEAVFYENNRDLVIRISSLNDDNDLLLWEVATNKERAEGEFTRLNIGFKTSKNTLSSIIKDISYFLTNPTSF